MPHMIAHIKDIRQDKVYIVSIGSTSKNLHRDSPYALFDGQKLRSSSKEKLIKLLALKLSLGAFDLVEPNYCREICFIVQVLEILSDINFDRHK